MNTMSKGKWEHTMACEYPEGCSCGASERNREDNLARQQLARQNARYKVIHDLHALHQFIDWLPELGTTERYYIVLMARSKYIKGTTCPTARGSQLRRIVCNKSAKLSKIQQLEVPVGTYRDRDGNEISQEALALYINVNPRCLRKATRNATKRLLDMALDPESHCRCDHEVMSSVQRSKSRTCWVCFDIDDTEKHPMEDVSNHVNQEAVSAIETRGGYHLMIDPKQIAPEFKQCCKTFSQWADVTGDMLSPLPGCYQGGHVPRLVT